MRSRCLCRWHGKLQVRREKLDLRRARCGGPGPVAEVDGNRTRQTENLGFTGFEDRGAHQERVHLHATSGLGLSHMAAWSQPHCPAIAVYADRPPGPVQESISGTAIRRVVPRAIRAWLNVKGCSSAAG